MWSGDLIQFLSSKNFELTGDQISILGKLN